MGKGIFGNLFDFDGDGELDVLEQTADIMAFDKLWHEPDDSDVTSDAGEDMDDLDI